MTGGNVVDVINTSSWSRTDLVVLQAGERRAGDCVVDTLGKPVPSQRLSNGGLAFVARDIPPLGARRYFVRSGSAGAPGNVKVDEFGLENGLISVKLDPQTGALRSLKTAAGVELADTSALRGLNQYCYVPGRDPRAVKTNRVIAHRDQRAGPLVGTLRVISEAPGCRVSRSGSDTRGWIGKGRAPERPGQGDGAGEGERSFRVSRECSGGLVSS